MSIVACRPKAPASDGLEFRCVLPSERTQMYKAMPCVSYTGHRLAHDAWWLSGLVLDGQRRAEQCCSDIEPRTMAMWSRGKCAHRVDPLRAFVVRTA